MAGQGKGWQKSARSENFRNSVTQEVYLFGIRDLEIRHFTAKR